MIMANASEFDSIRCTLIPSHAPVSFDLDPELGLTPERTAYECINHERKEPCKAKKAVRFVSPAKPKSSRSSLQGKENDLLGLELHHLSECPDNKKPNSSHVKQKKGKKNIIMLRETSNQSSLICSGNHLDRPELHTTLNLGRDILQLRCLDVDIVNAVKQRLMLSEVDRTKVKRKTFAVLNEKQSSKPIYDDVIAIDVEMENILKSAEEALQKSVKAVPARPTSGQDSDRPSLMTFFMPRLAFHNVVSQDQHGYEPEHMKVRLPPMKQDAYQLHRRTLSWSNP